MIPCTIIRDIMPIYLEDECSEETKKLIEEHLQECEKCREYYGKMNIELIQEEMVEDNTSIETDINKSKQGYSMKKALTKIRNRWIASLIIVIMFMIIVVPNVYLMHNEIKKEGICYSNLDEIYTSRKFLKAIKEENYGKAFAYFDIKSMYNENADYVVPEKTTLEENYKKVIIENEVYYVNEQVFLNEYALYNDNKDATAFWRDMYLSGVFMISEEGFNTLAQKDLKELDTIYETGSVIIEGKKYIVPKQMLQSVTNKSDTIELELGTNEYIQFIGDLYGWSIIPEVIYEEQNEEEIKQQEEWVEWAQKYKEIGYDEYYRLCKEKFINNMEQLKASGISIIQYEINHIYKADKSYSIEYELTLDDGQEKFNGQGVDLRVDEGKISITGGYGIDRKEEKRKEAYQKLLFALCSWDNIE